MTLSSFDLRNKSTVCGLGKKANQREFITPSDGPTEPKLGTMERRGTREDDIDEMSEEKGQRKSIAPAEIGSGSGKREKKGEGRRAARRT